MTEIVLARVGARLREFRHHHDLTLADLQQASGFDTSTLSRFENGLINFTAKTAVRLALAVGVEPWDLFVPREFVPDLKPKRRRHGPPSDAVLERHVSQVCRQIGDRIRALCQLQGMSVYRLEEFTGVPVNALKTMQAGRTNFRTSSLVRLADAIGVQPHELYVPTEQSRIRPKGDP